jgi:signal transduction histidine kinase
VPSFATALPRFDARQLARWRLDERRLPEDSQVMFREPSLWQQYRWHVAGAAGLIGAQAALIVTLVVQRRRRREAEAAALRLLAQLAHLDRVAAMGQLASSLAHELSQPLTAILANAQAANRLLARPQLDLEELRACVVDVISDDRRASEMIRGMWKLLKRTDVVSTPLRLNDLAANMIALVANDALLHEVTLQFLPAADVPVAYGDGVQIQQVILNLLTNAITAAANLGAPHRSLIVKNTAATAPYTNVRVLTQPANGSLGSVSAGSSCCSSRPRSMGWVWGWPSATRSSRPTAAGSWSGTIRPGVRSSAFTCVPTVTVVTRERRLLLRRYSDVFVEVSLLRLVAANGPRRR